MSASVFRTYNSASSVFTPFPPVTPVTSVEHSETRALLEHDDIYASMEHDDDTPEEFWDEEKWQEIVDASNKSVESKLCDMGVLFDNINTFEGDWTWDFCDECSN